MVGFDNSVYVSFDGETSLCVVDNCANVHIWNCFQDFVAGTYIKFNQAASTGVSAVNGKSNKPAGIGDVALSWTDDDGKVYNIVLKNVLHFPNSPVKILSVVGLAEQLDDDVDTWILSRRHESLFTWDRAKHSKTIQHGSSKLPELMV